MQKSEYTLESLAPGQSGIILSVGNERGAVKRRLIDMGLTPGTQITVKKLAPFGDPIEVRLRGFDLSLRKRDAAQIIIGSAKPVRRRKNASAQYPARKLPQETLERMRLAHMHELDNHPVRYDSSAHDKRKMSIALAGNPNSGKTTLFNALTGSNQYVGNWPGVTVEKKEGSAEIGGKEVRIVDLPGIYSLSPYSMEELVARDYILGADGGEPPDAIINIVDATNIERNMYLTVQLLELERPMVVALNFMDEARKAGDEIDEKKLAKELGIPVVPITAKTGENLEELLHIAHRQMHIGYTIEPDDLYDDFTHEIHHRIGQLIHDSAYAAGLPAHWTAIKLLEGDDIVAKSLRLPHETSDLIAEIAREYENAGTHVYQESHSEHKPHADNKLQNDHKLHSSHNAESGHKPDNEVLSLGDRESLVADSRYNYIEKILSSSLKKGSDRHETISDKIDKIATHKIFAVPLFLIMMLVMFAITFGPPGAFLSDGVAFIIDSLSGWLGGVLESINVEPWLVGLVTDGIIAGVGGVLTFLPQIAVLFFFLSLLEDSGYMARAAFIMDRLLRHFGLSGKAFIPMLMGFGCTVPAIMGARTMENEKDRRMTMMLVPFMSCSAKLPIYGLITAAFFGAWAGPVVFILYVLGMVMAVVSGVILNKTIFAGEPAAFVLELPPYRLPTINNTLIHVWERVKGFLVRAGTLILLMSIVLWFLQSFGTKLQMVENSADSILAVIGGAIAPLFKPLGFGVWQASVALLTGFIAKEAVVASLSMFYGFSLTAAGGAVAAAMSGFSPLSAMSFLVFILLYVPCVAAVSTLYKEMNSLKWTLLSVGWQLAAAYIMSLLVFGAGLLLGLK